MTAQPQRRAVRQEHLDARVVPVERALLARAEAVSRQADAEMDVAAVKALNIVAVEFRLLADELHYWS